jgi:hypothetical protein
MDNPKRGEYSFEADGKEYTLQYSNESLIKLEEDLDKGIVRILREVESWKDPENIRLGLVRSLLWAGLIGRHPETTKEQAAELISKAGGVVSVIGFVGEALQRAFSAPGTKGTHPPQTTNGTGTASSSDTAVSGTIQDPSGFIHPVR